MAERVRTHDWAATSLGAVATWPEFLKAVVELTLTSSLPMVVLWGPDLVQIYNDEYRELMGEKHPAGLGQPTHACWPEVWHVNEPIYERVRAGEAVTFEDALYPMAHDGTVAERRFTLSYSPLRDGTPEVAGVLVVVLRAPKPLRAARTESGLAPPSTFTLAGAVERLLNPDAAFLLAEPVFAADGTPVDYVLVEYNSAFERQSGLTDVAGKRARELDPHVESFWIDTFAGVASTGESLRFERCDPFTARYYDVYASRVESPSGRVRVAAVFNDVTSRKRAEEALRKSEERQAFLVRLNDALRPLEEPTEIQGVAASVLGERLGVSRALYFDVERGADGDSYVVRRDYRAPNVPEPPLGFDASYSGATLFDALRFGRTVVVADVETEPLLTEAERSAHRATGVGAYVAVPVIKAGRYVAVFVVHQTTPRSFTADETALVEETGERTAAATDRANAKRQREALLAAATAARAEAEIANNTKDEFLATLSHELRTPLAAILLWAGALRSGALPPSELGRALEAIVHSAESQSKLIEDLLDLSRLQSGKLLLARRRSSIVEVAYAAVDVVRKAAEVKGVALDTDIDDELGTAVVDPIRFQQILWNLLSNAIKFTPAGGRVALWLGENDGQLEARVSDTGEGIAPEFKRHLFERFRQADMGETRQHAGLGIGLALTRSLVELHGGSIEAHSEGTGRGSLFLVRLPLVRTERGPANPVTRAASPLATALKNVMVLLVEDDESTREAMHAALTRAGAGVVSVGSGAEALAVLDDMDDDRNGDTAPDILVSDLRLPGMSGYELIDEVGQRYRARGKRPIPACAVSADARDTDRQRAIEAGFDVYLAKPVTLEKLVEAIEDLRAVAATSET
jgi:signal transduction histidine kinase/CheY-like chemotaxis protein